jgi:hypothetical protein
MQTKSEIPSLPNKKQTSIKTIAANSIPNKDVDTTLTKQIPKTEWKQLPNGTWYRDTKAGNKATVKSVNNYKNGGGDPPPKKILPTIYTSDFNDPGIKAYSDSLNSYNYTQNNLKKYKETGLSRQGTPIDFSSKKYVTKKQGIKNTYDENLPLMQRMGLPFTMEDAAQEWHRFDKTVKNIGAYQFKNDTGRTSTLFDYKKPVQPVKYRNPEILAKQQQLIDAGYDIGGADGIWGKKSQAAWEDFQARQSITPEPKVKETVEKTKESQQVLKKEQPKGLTKQVPKTKQVWSDLLQMYVPVTRAGQNATVESVNNYRNGGGDPPPKNLFLPTSSSFDPAALNRIYQDVKEQEKIQYLPEQQIYATPESRKKYEDVYAKAQSLVKTFPRAAEYFTKNKRYKNQGIEGVSEYVKDITDFQKSAEDYYKARQSVKKGRMSTEAFERAYRERGWQQFDSKNVKTSEEDQKQLEETWYGPTDEQGRRYWMSNPMNVAKVAEGTAAAAVLGPGAVASGVAAPVGYALSNPFVNTALTSYGLYDAAANTIPDAYRAFEKGDTWGGIGNASLATLDLALPFIPWGKVAPKLLPGVTSEFAGDIAKIKNDYFSRYSGVKDINNIRFPGSTFDLLRNASNYSGYKKGIKEIDKLDKQALKLESELETKVKERKGLKDELDKIYYLYDNQSLTSKNRKALRFEKNKIEDKISAYDKLIESKEKGLIELVDNYNLKVSSELATFKNTGSMKTELEGGQDYVIDFETGEKIPFGIKVPKGKKTLSTVKGAPTFYSNAKNRVITTDTEILDNDYSMSPEAMNTIIKNINYVKERFPGSVEFGSSVFAKIGLPHATDDIDLITTRRAFDEIEKLGYKEASGTRARYGKSYDLEGKTKIDVNVIEEGKDGMATGELASELYRVYYPDEFYSQMSELALKEIKTGVKPNISELKINVTPEELLAKVQENPAIKTLVDAFEAGSSSALKAKHLNRTDYILENAQDIETVKKAQEAWIKSIAGSKGNTGFQFSPQQLLDNSSGVAAYNSIKRNKEILEKIGITENLGYNVSKIASNADRMQLFLNDYLMHSATFSRNINDFKFKEILKKEGKEINLENLRDAYITWKKSAGGGSVKGYGINFVEYGDSQHYGGITGDVFYNLTNNKNYSDPLEYINDIERQVKASYVFNKSEKDLIKELADKHSIKLNNLSLDFSDGFLNKGDLISGVAEPKLIEGEKDYSKLTAFYKDLGETLGLKAISRVDLEGSYGNSFYSSGLGNIDKELDSINISLTELKSDKFGKFSPVPKQKSRKSRQDNLKLQSSKTKVQNEIMYNLQTLDFKIGAINNYNETVKQGLLNKKEALIKEIEDATNSLKSRITKNDKVKEIIGGKNYKKFNALDVRSSDLVETKDFATGKLGEVNKKLIEIEKNQHRTASKIRELKEEQELIESVLDDEALTNMALVSIFLSPVAGTFMAYINSKAPREKKKEKLEKEKTKSFYEQLPNGTYVKRTYTDVGKTEKKNYGGNLNTFNYQQNMLPLQTITEPQEVELTPEEINYYRSLGYEVEELD